jgi:hypothetical protein
MHACLRRPVTVAAAAAAAAPQVCTIHQPQSKIFSLFDSLTILKAGDIMYQVRREAGVEAALPAGEEPALLLTWASHCPGSA